MENLNTNRNWKELVLEQETSSLSQNEFCESKDIKIDAYKNHRAKYKTKKITNPKNIFVEVISSKIDEKYTRDTDKSYSFQKIH